jgi:serine protease AprX
MIPIPSPLVEFILLGPLEDRRQLQDSPILGDVWVEFGKKPDARLDLLISPYRGQHAGHVADKIDQGLEAKRATEPETETDPAAILKRELERDPKFAFLQGLIVARLTFEEVAELVVPKTKWWTQRWKEDEVKAPKKKGQKSDEIKSDEKKAETHDFQKNYSPSKVEQVLETILSSARHWHRKTLSPESQELPALDRFVALTGLLLWAGDQNLEKSETDSVSAADQISNILDKAKAADIAPLLIKLGGNMLRDPARKPLVWQVSLNRAPLPALVRSIPAVKADAAHTLFKIDCSEIAWAVIDSGIDGNHPAFGNRVQRSFDFKNFRKIVSLSNSKDAIRKANLAELQEKKAWDALKTPPTTPDEDLQKLAADARSGLIHWELVERFVEIKTTTPPPTNHGTHVAGIIGASKKSAEAALKPAAKTAAPVPVNSDFADGMCPDIQLYDFRVLGREIKDAEFAIIAALQFIRYLNDRDNFITIHGANLSLSIPHDVRNFACGRTPICNECERLIESGVVVVTAAGNHGYKSFETKEGSYDSYAAFSITDPGNADGVITVGATHRFWPHTYGVSFFSSRGPTGDGRLKPDLVAPGERIRAPLSGGDPKAGGDWGDLDGTSMAAPHVSGAAAMLMARYSELIGQPRRIKRILCENATDLGRERSFQGHGMLDVLRAFQSI